MIRTVILLCFTATLAAAGPLVDGEALCNLCSDAANELDAGLTDRIVHARTMGKLEAVCGLVTSPRKKECTDVLTGLTQEVLYHLMEDLKPMDICMAMTACPSNTDVRTQITPAKKNVGDANETCELCEFLVKTLDSLLTNKTTPAAANATVQKVCNALPIKFKQTCLTFAPLIVDAVLNGVDPVGACTNIGVCLTAPVFEHVQARPSANNLKAGALCELCELAITALDKYLSENRTDAAINATVYELCGDLPGTLKKDCLSFAPALVSALANGVDPKVACTIITLCDSAEAKIAPKAVYVPVEKSVQVGGPACEVCELLVGALDKYLSENATAAQVNATVYQLCSALPGSLSQTCLSFAPLIVKALADGVDPKTACTDVKLCDAAGAKIDLMKINFPVKLGVEASSNCLLCELAVQTLDSYLASNATEATINATLYKICGELPGTLKDTCVSFAPLVVKAMSDGVDPKTLCTDIKMCNSTGVKIAPMKIEVPVHRSVGASPACELCELIVQTLDQYLADNATIAVINSTLYEMCGELPGSFKNECLSFAPQLIKALADGVDPKTACTDIKICASAGANTTPLKVMLPAKMSVEASPACDLCVLIVQTLDQYLEQNASIAVINATLYEMCGELPGSFKNECLSFAPELIKALSDGVDPKTACTDIKICASAGAKITPMEVILSEKKSVGASPACGLCELIVQTLDQYLADNATIAVINSTLYQLCGDLPGSFKNECLSFAPQLLKALSDGVDPKTACTDIKICTSASAIITPVKPSVGAGPACTLCEIVVPILDQYLEANATIDFVNATLFELCEDLPGGVFTNVCLSFAPELIQALADGVDPKTACTDIKVCPSETTIAPMEVKRPVKRSVGAGPACELCEQIIQIVDTYLGDNATDATINATLISLCNALPEPLKNECLSFAPQLMAALVKGVDPKAACTEIKLCTSADQRLTFLSHVLLNPRAHPARTEMAVDWCDICKNAVGIIDNDLYKEEGTVQNFLDEICHRLPPPTDKACLTAADQKFPQIWENFLKGIASADNVCKLLEACPK